MFFRKKKINEVKTWMFVLLIFIIASAILLKVYNLPLHWKTTDIKIKNDIIKVLVSDRPALRYKGLSDRADFGKSQGMLFKFDSKDYHTMVMRDMKFDLDIIWVDSGKIIDMAQNLRIEPSVSEIQLIRYRPRLPATIVIELPAGYVLKNSLKIGDSVIIYD